jgi:hypothetical protein
MPVFDSGFKIVTRNAGRQLTEMGGVAVDDLTPVLSEVQTTERFADRAFLARRGRHRFVVYLEAYTYWKREAPWNLLNKSGLLSERERLPTVCLVFILLPRRYRPQQGQFRLAVGGDVTQLLRFREICLWEQEPQLSWEQSPGLMALYPLCRHGRPPGQAIAYAAGSIQNAVRDTIVRADLLTTLGFFGRLAYRDLDVFGFIGRDQMKESSLYQEILDEGRLEARQADVLDNLEARFGSRAAAQFAEAVHGITELDRLKHLLRVAATCTTTEQFGEELAAPPGRRRRRP